MDFMRYIVILLMAQAVQSNTLGHRHSRSNSTQTNRQSDKRQKGVVTGDNLKLPKEPVELVSIDDSTMTSDNPNAMTSSEILLRTVTSPKFDSLVRIKRARSPKRKRCDSSNPESCKKNRRKSAKRVRSRKNKNRRKCKGKGKGRKRSCRKKTPNPTKPPPMNFTISMTPGREECIRSTECPPGHCCARHHYTRICKPMKKEGDICSKKRKNRRDAEYFELCGCEDGLVCRQSQGRNRRLFTCQKALKT